MVAKIAWVIFTSFSFEPGTVCVIQVKCAIDLNGIFKLLMDINIEFK